MKLVLAYLRGRGRRLEYWLSLIAMIVGVFAVLEIPHDELFGDAVDWVSLAVWCAFAARRLRDAGLPFWLAPFPLPIVLVGLALNRIVGVPPSVAASPEASMSLASLLAALTLLALVFVLGCLPSRAPKATTRETADIFG
ncbi:hypothetical protein SGCZBJ_13055 [Caulobacter zeae]|uniref:DUF805 domain-containing protein n=1 Tax=Caulobacter zeae TaxID=2055137 RepID=A0A2N5DGH0_9CAUL|nr:DUF805 domain-containing protein [Caulobacter zeae]PLR25155.1 hypothetical protein SGCZBJ_13055 [Caulobacter zeae]